MPLLTTVTTATNPSDSVKIAGGDRIFAFQGDFDEATLSVEVSYDSGTTWITLNEDINGTAFGITAAGIYVFNLGKSLVRFRLTGANSDSDPAAVSVYIS